MKRFGVLALFMTVAVCAFAATNKSDWGDDVYIDSTGVIYAGQGINATGEDIIADDITLTGNIAGDGTGEISGMLVDQETGITNDTLTVAESKRTFIITTACEKELPAVSAGVEYILQAGGAVAIRVDPAVADTIKVGTLVLDAGDKITTSGVTGDTIRIIGGDTANTWYASCYPNACTDGGA